MAAARSFQSPKGTRDFYPPDMAVRRHIEGIWRSASVDSGFEEIEGPMFEHLEMYTVKSGEGIISQLFSFRRDGGKDDYALRPEFTPTLARMAAAKGKSLAIPTKWFAMPSHFRAERPQRGRLREHTQWNVDVIGIEDSSADVEVISTALLALERFGLTSNDVRVRLSHRGAVAAILRAVGVSDEHMADAFGLLDRRDKMKPEDFRSDALKLGLDEETVARFDEAARVSIPLSDPLEQLANRLGVKEAALSDLAELRAGLVGAGLDDWCVIDMGIVRGLNYYTGTVFEIFDSQGAERAIAGGGRYDNLVALFGGPSLPACGFGMGDVVINLVLQERGLLGPDAGESLLPRPDVYLVSTSDAGDEHVGPMLVTLRRAGLHARRSHKATRNLGKLLADAGKANARSAMILGEELADGCVAIKDLESGDQETIAVAEAVDALCTRYGASA